MLLLLVVLVLRGVRSIFILGCWLRLVVMGTHIVLRIMPTILPFDLLELEVRFALQHGARL